MKIELESGDSALTHAELIILPVLVTEPKRSISAAARGRKENRKQGLDLPTGLREIATTLDPLVNGQFSRKLKELAFRGEAGKRLVLQLNRINKGKIIGEVQVRIHCIAFNTRKISGAGERSAAARAALGDSLRRLGGDAAQAAEVGKFKRAAVVIPNELREMESDAVQAFVEGAALSRYRFTRFKGVDPKTTQRAKVPTNGWRVDICGVSRNKSLKVAVSVGLLNAEATCFVRDLVNTPPSDLPPSGIVSEAKRIVSKSKGRITAKYFGRSALQRMKAGALLGVSRGSDLEPFLLHLVFKPRKGGGNRKKIVLVGKGVTFDSGGLSIKTGQGMMEMKCDMAGAASVLAVMRSIVALDAITPIRHEIHAVIPTTENMINGLSLKPGDVVRAINGKTIEVLNTDAEGRLILADALSYLKTVQPDVVVDIATLTGACVVALGSDFAGLFSNSEELAAMVQDWGSIAGDRFWRMPLAREYRPHIDSSVADIKNISTSSGPGAIIGAIFLEEFVPKDCAWAHLDIAGTAFTNRGSEVSTVGGTGFGVRTLIRIVSELGGSSTSAIQELRPEF